jgi:DNA adenine methylase
MAQRINPIDSAGDQAIMVQVTKADFKSPLRYPGGKQKAIAQISKEFPSSIREYREPMVGGGSVYFYARSKNLAKSYWINDRFKELVQFWLAAQNPAACQRLMNDLRQLRATCITAKKFKQYFLTARGENPVEDYRAAFLFFFFNRVTFSGTTRAGGFSSSASLRRFTDSSIERLASMPEALKNAQVSNLDFAEVVEKPGKDVFVFLDPPYFTATRLYGKNGSLHEFDHDRLASVLKHTGHRFLITYDDCAEIRKLYNWAKIKNWQLQYGMNNCNLERQSKIGSELFISNY